ncbi:MAG: SDR family oxidoreductase [Desulfobacterales bacterium]|jgi:NAD(P)-dependent dehydrogenase (short-subunit alcohol dehydrogenase family)
MTGFTEWNLFNLSERAAVITGACRGIGKAIAFGLANYGAHVTLVDMLPEEIGQREVMAIEKLTGAKGLYVRADVSKLDEVQAMVRKTIAQFQTIDILVNSAAVVQRALTEETGPGVIRALIDVNLIGLFYCCQEVGKVMLKNQRGSIINISSTDAEAGVPNVAVYSATKGGVNALTRALAIEWAKHGIRVNAISPCVVETDMLKPLLEDRDRRQAITDSVPLGISKPEDFQGPAIFLASNASLMVTGHILHVDGGYLAT